MGAPFGRGRGKRWGGRGSGTTEREPNEEVIRLPHRWASVGSGRRRAKQPLRVLKLALSPVATRRSAGEHCQRGETATCLCVS